MSRPSRKSIPVSTVPVLLIVTPDLLIPGMTPAGAKSVFQLVDDFGLPMGAPVLLPPDNYGLQSEQEAMISLDTQQAEADLYGAHWTGQAAEGSFEMNVSYWGTESTGQDHTWKSALVAGCLPCKRIETATLPSIAGAICGGKSDVVVLSAPVLADEGQEPCIHLHSAQPNPAGYDTVTGEQLARAIGRGLNGRAGHGMEQQRMPASILIVHQEHGAASIGLRACAAGVPFVIAIDTGGVAEETVSAFVHALASKLPRSFGRVNAALTAAQEEVLSSQLGEGKVEEGENEEDKQPALIMPSWQLYTYKHEGVMNLIAQRTEGDVSIRPASLHAIGLFEAQARLQACARAAAAAAAGIDAPAAMLGPDSFAPAFIPKEGEIKGSTTDNILLLNKGGLGTVQTLLSASTVGRTAELTGLIGPVSAGKTIGALKMARHAVNLETHPGGVFFLPIGDIAAAVRLEDFPAPDSYGAEMEHEGVGMAAAAVGVPDSSPHPHSGAGASSGAGAADAETPMAGDSTRSSDVNGFWSSMEHHLLQRLKSVVSLGVRNFLAVLRSSGSPHLSPAEAHRLQATWASRVDRITSSDSFREVGEELEGWKNVLVLVDGADARLDPLAQDPHEAAAAQHVSSLVDPTQHPIVQLIGDLMAHRLPGGTSVLFTARTGTVLGSNKLPGELGSPYRHVMCGLLPRQVLHALPETEQQKLLQTVEASQLLRFDISKADRLSLGHAVSLCRDPESARLILGLGASHLRDSRRDLEPQEVLDSIDRLVSEEGSSLREYSMPNALGKRLLPSLQLPGSAPAAIEPEEQTRPILSAPQSFPSVLWGKIPGDEVGSACLVNSDGLEKAALLLAPISGSSQLVGLVGPQGSGKTLGAVAMYNQAVRSCLYSGGVYYLPVGDLAQGHFSSGAAQGSFSSSAAGDSTRGHQHGTIWSFMEHQLLKRAKECIGSGIRRHVQRMTALGKEGVRGSHDHAIAWAERLTAVEAASSFKALGNTMEMQRRALVIVDGATVLLDPSKLQGDGSGATQQVLQDSTQHPIVQLIGDLMAHRLPGGTSVLFTARTGTVLGSNKLPGELGSPYRHVMCGLLPRRLLEGMDGVQINFDTLGSSSPRLREPSLPESLALLEQARRVFRGQPVAPFESIEHLRSDCATKLEQLTANLKCLANGSSPRFKQIFMQHLSGLAQRPALAVGVHLKGSGSIHQFSKGHDEKTALKNGLDPEPLSVGLLFPEKTPPNDVLHFEKTAPLDGPIVVMRSNSGGPAVAAASAGSDPSRIEQYGIGDAELRQTEATVQSDKRRPSGGAGGSLSRRVAESSIAVASSYPMRGLSSMTRTARPPTEAFDPETGDPVGDMVFCEPVARRDPAVAFIQDLSGPGPSSGAGSSESSGHASVSSANLDRMPWFVPSPLQHTSGSPSDPASATTEVEQSLLAHNRVGLTQIMDVLDPEDVSKRSAQCIGLLGWPRSGKTSVVMAVGRHARWRDRFTGGVFFVPVGDILAATSIEELPIGDAMEAWELEGWRLATQAGGAQHIRSPMQVVHGRVQRARAHATLWSKMERALIRRLKACVCAGILRHIVRLQGTHEVHTVHEREWLVRYSRILNCDSLDTVAQELERWKNVLVLIDGLDAHLSTADVRRARDTWRSPEGSTRASSQPDRLRGYRPLLYRARHRVERTDHSSLSTEKTMVTLGLDLQLAQTNGLDLEDPIDHPGIKLLMGLIQSGESRPRPEGTCVLYTAGTGTLLAAERPPVCLLKPDHVRHVVCGLMPRRLLDRFRQAATTTGVAVAASDQLGKASPIPEAAAAGGDPKPGHGGKESSTLAAATATRHGTSGVEFADISTDDDFRFIHPRLLGGDDAAVLAAAGASEPDAPTDSSRLPAAICRRLETLDEKQKDAFMLQLADLDFAAAVCEVRSADIWGSRSDGRGLLDSRAAEVDKWTIARVPTCAVPLREQPVQTYYIGGLDAVQYGLLAIWRHIQQCRTLFGHVWRKAMVQQQLADDNEMKSVGKVAVERPPRHPIQSMGAPYVPLDKHLLDSFVLNATLDACADIVGGRHLRHWKIRNSGTAQHERAADQLREFIGNGIDADAFAVAASTGVRSPPKKEARAHTLEHDRCHLKIRGLEKTLQRVMRIDGIFDLPEGAFVPFATHEAASEMLQNTDGPAFVIRFSGTPGCLAVSIKPHSDLGEIQQIERIQLRLSSDGRVLVERDDQSTEAVPLADVLQAEVPPGASVCTAVDVVISPKKSRKRVESYIGADDRPSGGPLGATSIDDVLSVLRGTRAGVDDQRAGAGDTAATLVRSRAQSSTWSLDTPGRALQLQSVATAMPDTVPRGQIKWPPTAEADETAAAISQGHRWLEQPSGAGNNINEGASGAAASATSATPSATSACTASASIASTELDFEASVQRSAEEIADVLYGRRSFADSSIRIKQGGPAEGSSSSGSTKLIDTERGLFLKVSGCTTSRYGSSVMAAKALKQEASAMAWGYQAVVGARIPPFALVDVPGRDGQETIRVLGVPMLAVGQKTIVMGSMNRGNTLHSLKTKSSVRAVIESIGQSFWLKTRDVKKHCLHVVEHSLREFDFVFGMERDGLVRQEATWLANQQIEETADELEAIGSVYVSPVSVRKPVKKTQEPVSHELPSDVELHVVRRHGKILLDLHRSLISDFFWIEQMSKTGNMMPRVFAVDAQSSHSVVSGELDAPLEWPLGSVKQLRSQTMVSDALQAWSESKLRVHGGSVVPLVAERGAGSIAFGLAQSPESGFSHVLIVSCPAWYYGDMPLLSCMIPPDAADVARRRDKQKQGSVPRLDPDCLMSAGQKRQEASAEQDKMVIKEVLESMSDRDALFKCAAGLKDLNADVLTDKEQPQPDTAGNKSDDRSHETFKVLRGRAKAVLKENGLPLRRLGKVVEADKLASFDNIPDDLQWTCGLPSRSSPAGGALEAFIRAVSQRSAIVVGNVAGACASARVYASRGVVIGSRPPPNLTTPFQEPNRVVQTSIVRASSAKVIGAAGLAIDGASTSDAPKAGVAAPAAAHGAIDDVASATKALPFLLKERQRLEDLGDPSEREVLVQLARMAGHNDSRTSRIGLRAAVRLGSVWMFEEESNDPIAEYTKASLVAALARLNLIHLAAETHGTATLLEFPDSSPAEMHVVALVVALRSFTIKPTAGAGDGQITPISAVMGRIADLLSHAKKNPGAAERIRRWLLDTNVQILAARAGDFVVDAMQRAVRQIS